MITLRDEGDYFFNTNAGKTRSYGIEYGITWNPIKELSISHNGSYAKHRYVEFFEDGIDLSNTEREVAPNLLGNSSITYRKSFGEISFNATAEYELVGEYNTSFEDQVENEDGSFNTATYEGYSVFNLRAIVAYEGFEVWGHALNIFDKLYATRASFSSFSNENSFTIGNPRAFHLGARYSF